MKFTVRVLWLFIGPLPSSLVQVVLSSYCMSHTILSSRNRAVWNQIKDVSFIKEKHFKKKQQLLLEKKGRGAQETQNSRGSLEGRSGVGGLLSLKICCKGTLGKPVWYWHKDRYVDQWVGGESSVCQLYLIRTGEWGVESSEVDLCTCGHF